MAVRSEELYLQRERPAGRSRRTTARVYKFPPVRARRAAVHRRRLALGTVAVLVVVAGLFATGPSGVAPAASQRVPRSVVLHEGDTVWEIADRYAPENMDVRTYIDAIVRLNGLDGLPPTGTKLRLP